MHTYQYRKKARKIGGMFPAYATYRPKRFLTRCVYGRLMDYVSATLFINVLVYSKRGCEYISFEIVSISKCSGFKRGAEGRF